MALVDGAAYERAMEENAFLNGVAKGLSEENDRLKADLANMYRLYRERGALTDEAADILSRVIESEDPEETERWQARWRKERGL